MPKLKLYLDTSVISHLDAPDAPERMRCTRLLWQDIIDGKHEVFLSEMVLREIDDCYEAKRTILAQYLTTIEYQLIATTDEVYEFGKRFIDLGILRKKSIKDSVHLAAAIIGGCDIVVSWNFRDMVNIRTINGVRKIAALDGRTDILIYSPEVLLGEKYGHPQTEN